MMIKHVTYLIGGALLLALVSGHDAYASEMVYLPFGAAKFGIAKYVVVMKVLHTSKTSTYQKLKNGDEGPRIADDLKLEGEVVENLRGDLPLAPLTATYHEDLPAEYDENGGEVMHASPILSGSGIEWFLEPGTRYIVSLEQCPTSKTYKITRIDKLTDRTAIEAALKSESADTISPTK